jgi:hypothetical protein
MVAQWRSVPPLGNLTTDWIYAVAALLLAIAAVPKAIETVLHIKKASKKSVLNVTQAVPVWW